MLESDSKIRALYHYIAEGTVCSDSWYRHLNNPEEIINVDKFVESRIERDKETTKSDNSVIPIMDKTGLEDASNSEDDDKEDDTEIVLSQFAETLESFKAKVMGAYQKSSLKKGVKYFTKQLRKFTKQNDNSLEKSLFSIGKEINKPKSGGKRKKLGDLFLSK